MKVPVALVLVGVLTCPSYAQSHSLTLAAPLAPREAPRQDNSQILVKYLKELPIGSRVRVELKDRRIIKGTLMAADEIAIVVQRHTREPEPADTVPIASIATVRIDEGGGMGRAIAIGLAAGAAAVLTLILYVAAIGDN